MPEKKIRVLIVDDSALVRKVLTRVLSGESDIEVVGAAPDPLIARDKIKELDPDVLTLDVEMPKMDGITFLRNLMRLRPMPVVMISSLTQQGAAVTLDALELGAVDFVTKPGLDIADGLAAYKQDIVDKIRVAAGATVRALPDTKQRAAVSPRLSADAVLAPGGARRNYRTTDQIIAIGASTGGTEAIKEVVSVLPADAPAIVVTQHIPLAFSGPFAERLNRLSAMTVKQAEDGDQILRGHVYVAPGDRHLLVVRSGARYVCRLSDGPPVNRHRPSVDVLFRSVAQYAGINAIGVLLTGMGADGAQGLLEMRDAGAETIVQDEATSVVWGMPGEAFRLGAAGSVQALEKIAQSVLTLAARKESSADIAAAS